MKRNQRILGRGTVAGIMALAWACGSVAFAQGEGNGGGASGVGGGGDTTCKAFYEIASNQSLGLGVIGQERIDQINRLIKAQAIREIVMHLKVIPGNDFDREAWSKCERSEIGDLKCLTRLDTKKFKAMDTSTRYKLVSHELAVMADLESDGEYGLSSDIVRIMKLSRYGLDLKAESYEINSDLSYTIYAPVVRDGNLMKMISAEALSNRTGVCVYLGFKTYLASQDKFRSQDWSYTRVIFDGMGHAIADTAEPQELERIICADPQ